MQVDCLSNGKWTWALIVCGVVCLSSCSSAVAIPKGPAEPAKTETRKAAGIQGSVAYEDGTPAGAASVVVTSTDSGARTVHDSSPTATGVRKVDQ